MKFRLLVAALLVATVATPALAGAPYVSALGGVSFFHDSDATMATTLIVEGIGNLGNGTTVSYDTGYGFDVGVGYRFDNGFRVQGDFGYKHADMARSIQALQALQMGLFDRAWIGDATVKSYLFSGLYDFANSSAVTPYLGAGVGALQARVSLRDDHDTVFGYHLTAGAAFRVARNLDLDLCYDFEGTGPDFELNGSHLPYHSSNVLAGLRYTFR